MGMNRDTYQMWQDTGQLPQVLEFIKECSRKLVTQKEMCRYLNLDEATFTRLKKKHPELDEAFHKAKLALKKDLLGALYKKAIGYELVEEEQFIEDKGKGEQQKRKIHRTKKQVGPDYKAIVYLLNKHFGREFNERYDDFEILKEKQALFKEEWNDGSQEVECDADER